MRDTTTKLVTKVSAKGSNHRETIIHKTQKQQNTNKIAKIHLKNTTRKKQKNQ